MSPGSLSGSQWLPGHVLLAARRPSGNAVRYDIPIYLYVRKTSTEEEQVHISGFFLPLDLNELQTPIGQQALGQETLVCVSGQRASPSSLPGEVC